PVLRAMRARLRADGIPAPPPAQVSAQADDVSRLLTITAQAGSTRLAAASANALAGALQMTTRARGSAVSRALTVLVPAAAPAAQKPLAPGIWLTRAEVMRLPDRGPAWEQVRKLATEPMGNPDLANQDSDHDVHVLAAALAYARTGDESLRQKARAGLMGAI